MSDTLRSADDAVCVGRVDLGWYAFSVALVLTFLAMC